MEEQQINNQNEPQEKDKSSAKTSSLPNILDGVSAVGALGGAVLSVVTQQIAVAAFPLALAVGVHVLNRRQSIKALEDNFQNIVLQQNLHIVKAEQQLQQLQDDLGQFQKESWLALEAQEQDLQAKIERLGEQIKQLQQQTSNLDESTQSLASSQEQLTEVVGELRQLENCSQALRSEPSAAQVYHQRGFTHQRLGDKQGAIEDYSMAISLNSKYAQAYLSRGILYGEMGKRKLAIADLRVASKLYFEQGDLESYQKARDLGKEFYDLRDVIEEQILINAQETEKPQPKAETNVDTKFKAPSSVSVAHLFA